MSVREVTAAGFEAQMLATALLQRARRGDPEGGIWEAADVQWWWRAARRSDEVKKLFWVDDEGPVAGVLLTSWSDDDWQCDPIVVLGASGVVLNDLWSRTLELASRHAPTGFTVPVNDDDRVFREMALQSGLAAGEQDNTKWMDAADRPVLSQPAEGFVLTDRTQRQNAPHHMQQRSGEHVAERLEECPLYDPELDLIFESTDGWVAGYSLYWFDPTTKVGLVEPVRVEDEFQRKGLARAMLSAGIERLAMKGAARIKVSCSSDAACALYESVGFRQASTTTWYRAE